MDHEFDMASKQVCSRSMSLSSFQLRRRWLARLLQHHFEARATLLSPLAVRISALPLVIIPESVRSGASSSAVWRKLFRIAFVGSLAVVTVGPALVLLPERVGRLILGDSWDYVQVVLPIISLEYAALVWSSIAMVYLRFQGKSGQLLAATSVYPRNLDRGVHHHGVPDRHGSGVGGWFGGQRSRHGNRNHLDVHPARVTRLGSI